jgi:triacylglycerol lipase
MTAAGCGDADAQPAADVTLPAEPAPDPRPDASGAPAPGVVDAAAPDSGTAKPPPASGPDPVVFVHGHTGKPSDFKTMIAAFKAAGYPADHLRAIAYKDNVGRNEPQAHELAAFVDDVLATTKKDRVDIVAHSAGGVSSRYYLKLLGGKDKVRDYVSLAGAQHGNELAAFFPSPGAKDLAPAYDTTPGSIQRILNGDVTVGGTDETPFGAEDGGQIHYNAFWSDTDEVIHPQQSECLDQKSKNDCSSKVNTLISGVSHNAWLTKASTIAEVLKRVGLHDAQNP